VAKVRRMKKEGHCHLGLPSISERLDKFILTGGCDNRVTLRESKTVPIVLARDAQ
jgi:hypothetical protein